jgi:hypothetical protein
LRSVILVDIIVITAVRPLIGVEPRELAGSAAPPSDDPRHRNAIVDQLAQTVVQGTLKVVL